MYNNRLWCLFEYLLMWVIVFQPCLPHMEKVGGLKTLLFTPIDRKVEYPIMLCTYSASPSPNTDPLDPGSSSHVVIMWAAPVLSSHLWFSDCSCCDTPHPLCVCPSVMCCVCDATPKANLTVLLKATGMVCVWVSACLCVVGWVDAGEHFKGHFYSEINTKKKKQVHFQLR